MGGLYIDHYIYFYLEITIFHSTLFKLGICVDRMDKIILDEEDVGFINAGRIRAILPTVNSEENA